MKIIKVFILNNYKLNNNKFTKHNLRIYTENFELLITVNSYNYEYKLHF